MQVLSFVVLAAVAVSVFSQDEPFQCQPNISYPSHRKAFSYDFTPLYHDTATGSDNLFKRFDSNVMYFNFCGVSSSACWTPNAATCLRTADWDYLSAGTLSTQKITASDYKSAQIGKSAMFSYTDGDSDSCTNNVKRSTKIHVLCEPTAASAYFMDDYQAKDCAYTFYLYSSAGCGTEIKYNGGAGGGETFATVVLILFFIGLPLYFIVGFILNKYVFKKEGGFPDLLPNWSFWSSLPGLIVDGCKFIAHGFKKGDYVTL